MDKRNDHVTAPDLLLQEGFLLHRQGALGEAAARYRQVLKRDRKNVTAQRALGVALQGLGQLDEALASFARAAALSPNDPVGHHHHAAVLMLLERYDEAIAVLDRLLALAPDTVKAHVDRALALHALERNAEALAALDRAIALAPETPRLQIDRSTLLYHVGRLDDAVAAVERAAALQPDDPDVLFNRAFFALLRGHFAEGWRGYEHRPSARRLRDALPYPRWSGEADGATLVLHAEQGLGDTMQFVRFAGVLAARGRRVVLMGPPKLKALISTAPGVAAYVSEAAELRHFEPIRWLPLLSVPFVLGVTLQTVPHEVPYLTPDPARLAHWRERIGTQGLRIGVNWQGKVAGVINPGRSFPLAALAPLAEIAGVRLISLQKGADAELAASPLRARIEVIENFDSGPDAFADTAAVMASVDLVVTCDTSTAHLAGALACPTFVALKAFPEWRFMLDRDDSPWYPTMRLFRQRRPGEWDDVFDRIAAAVRAR
jgi:tetratricopeptide (TPR) repeat protein